jgi:hypothetical protein
MELLDSDALLSQVARPRNQQIKGLRLREPFYFGRWLSDNVPGLIVIEELVMRIICVAYP